MGNYRQLMSDLKWKGCRITKWLSRTHKMLMAWRYVLTLGIADLTLRFEIFHRYYHLRSKEVRLSRNQSYKQWKLKSKRTPYARHEHQVRVRILWYSIRLIIKRDKRQWTRRLKCKTSALQVSIDFHKVLTNVSVWEKTIFIVNKVWQPSLACFAHVAGWHCWTEIFCKFC